MNPLTFLVLSAFAAFTLTASEARAGSGCAAPTSCYFELMPLLDQTDEAIGARWLPNGGGNSQLCGPAAGAMALSAVISESKDTPTGWTSWAFRGKSSLDKIRNMAALMGTDPKSGTTIGEAADGVADREADFRNAGGDTDRNLPDVYNATYFLRLHSSKKRADIILYGHYTEKSKTVLGTRFTWYERDGGHFVAVNGHNGMELRIYNPWGGVREWRSISRIYGGTSGGIIFPDEVKVLPGIGSTGSVLYSSGDQVKIIDGETGLWAD